MNINYKSDFQIIESTENIDTSTPFRFIYKTSSNNTYEASYNGFEYYNCKREQDGSLRIIFSNHNLKYGILLVERNYYLTNADFKNGIQNVITIDDTGIRLVTGHSDSVISNITVIPNYQKGDKGVS